MTTLLRIDASARQDGSSSRTLGDGFVADLQAKDPNLNVVERDLINGMELLDQNWVFANFTAADQRESAQTERLAGSDTLVEELKDADILLLTVPIYNFGVPGALKAWIDQVCRAGLTFKYTENGPVGLLSGKRAVVIMTSGGTEVDGPQDFATPHIRRVLNFIGIDDVEVIAADQQMMKGETQIDIAAKALADASARLALAA